jgi:hypothetical protein
MLARVWPLLPERVRRSRQPELDEADHRFHAATMQWPGHNTDEDQWWKWRIPRLLQADPDEHFERGWPDGWEMMPFPKPDSVEIMT